MNISELLTLAQNLGNHPSRLVIWDEGSIAMKTDSGIAVSKAGASLATLKESDLAEFDPERILALYTAESVSDEMLAEAFPPEKPKPTTDVFLYAHLLGFDGVEYAAHVHPVEINQIVSSPRARQFADRRTLPHEILGCGSSVVLAPYADPGLPLAKETKKRIVLWRDRHKVFPKVILLQNHGMIVLGANGEEVLKTIEIMLKYAQVFLGAAMLGGPMFLTPKQVDAVEAEGNC